MDIDALVQRFAALPGARVGFGPRHPGQPDPALEERVAALFAEVPALARDQSYVDFIWRYAGASWVDADRIDMLDIFGINDASTRFDDFEEPLVDEDDGYFYFADFSHHQGSGVQYDVYNVGFLFNVDADRNWAVYRTTEGRFTVEQSPTPAFASFAEFLADVIERGGRCPRLTTPSGT